MECPHCRTQLPEGSLFCKECGKKLELTCPDCGKSIPPDSKFCLACAQQSAAKLPIEKAQPIADAERKHVTALFSGLSGYTAMTEGVDPEEVKEITRRFALAACRWRKVIKDFAKGRYITRVTNQGSYWPFPTDYGCPKRYSL